MVSKRSRVTSLRGIVAGSCCALLLGIACGENPELDPTDESFRGGAQLGEPCENGDECAAALVCGPSGTCVSACGEVSGDTCGDEACLDNGRCSQGLARDCKADDGCSDGLVCSPLGHCAVPCRPGATDACKGDETCRSDGTCPTDRDIVLGLGGASNQPDPDGAGGAASCIDVDVDFEPQIPTVLLLIDRSFSMNDEGGFGEAVAEAVAAGSYALGDCPSDNDWRWNVVRDVLMNPTKGIVKPLEERVRFGLSLYSSEMGRVKAGGDGEEVDETKSCPVLIEVPIALGNHQPMLDEFKCGDIFQDTPTGESLVAAAATLRAFPEPGPKVVVLATDGAPDNCECPNFTDDGDNKVPARCKLDGVPEMIQGQVVDTAGQIHAEGITIHVINVSTPSQATLQEHLEDVAEAGGGQIYPGFSPGALSTAFEDIINGVRSCKVDLDGQIAEGKEATGTVTLDGEILVLDDPDGWQVNTPSQIELLGSACEAIKSGGHDLAIKFPCESFDPVVQ